MSVDNNCTSMNLVNGKEGTSSKHNDDFKTDRNKSSISIRPESATEESFIASDTVYIGNIPLKYATEAVVEKLLLPHGTIRRVSVQHRTNNNNDSTTRYSFAFGQFDSSIAALKAINALNGRKLGGQMLVVKPAKQGNGKTPLSGSSGARVCDDKSVKNEKRLLDSKIEAVRKKLKR